MVGIIGNRFVNTESSYTTTAYELNVARYSMTLVLARQFEEMMDRLEKGSGQQVITLKEAKLLLKEDDELIVAVYDYWLNKRLRLVSAVAGKVFDDCLVSDRFIVAFTGLCLSRPAERLCSGSYQKVPASCRSALERLACRCGLSGPVRPIVVGAAVMAMAQGG